MARWNVVITDYYYESVEHERKELATVDACVRDYHCKTEEDVIEAARDCDALICQFAPITRRVIEQLKHCKVIVRYAIGVDNIDVIAAQEHGIYVCNVPDYGLDEVSNHAIALLLDCAKKLTHFTQEVKRGNCSYTVVKPLYRMRGKTLGLVGFGRIPRMVAEKMRGFGVNIVAYDPYLAPEEAQTLQVTSVSFEQLLTESDYISVHCPLTEETKHLFDRDAFTRMKPTAIFINTARGGVVSDEALVWALQNKKITMAGVDVVEAEPITPDHPLLALEQAVVTPHTAWYSEDAVNTLQLMAAQEVARILRGDAPKNPVNHPDKEAMTCLR